MMEMMERQRGNVQVIARLDQRLRVSIAPRVSATSPAIDL